MQPELVVMALPGLGLPGKSGQERERGTGVRRVVLT